MRMFQREENLLVAIHEGKTTLTGATAVSTLNELLRSGLVTGVEDGGDGYSQVTLTARGREVVSEILMRD